MRTMPKKLQIEMFKKIFLKANEDREEDVYARMDEIDFDNIIDDTLTFKENRWILKKNYPNFRWELPQKEPKQRKHEWKEKSLVFRGQRILYTMDTKIKPHKVRVKGKTYLCGRIQVTTDKKWIGSAVTVAVYVPIPKP